VRTLKNSQHASEDGARLKVVKNDNELSNSAMNIKQKLIGLLAASLVALGAACPLAVLADGAQPMATASTVVTLTPTQASEVQAMSAILATITTDVQAIVQGRSADAALFGQMSVQLSAMDAELQQGSVTPDMLSSMSVSVANMSSQVSSIIARRAQEDQAFAALSSVLGQLADWLRSLGA